MNNGRFLILNKAEALQSFYESFGIPAYDANSVPDDAMMPYITYSVSTDSLDNVVNLQASLWYKSSSWMGISNKADEIAQRLVEHNIIKLDGGYMYLCKGSPFAQRMADPSDDTVKRMYMNIQAEFFTKF